MSKPKCGHDKDSGAGVCSRTVENEGNKCWQHVEDKFITREAVEMTSPRGLHNTVYLLLDATQNIEDMEMHSPEKIGEVKIIPGKKAQSFTETESNDDAELLFVSELCSIAEEVELDKSKLSPEARKIYRKHKEDKQHDG